MARKLYYAANGASPTTGVQQSILTTNAGPNTMVQVATPSTTDIVVIEWGISFVGTTATDAPVKCELIQTDVACTAGTSLTPTVWGDPNAPASLCVGGTGATMFNDGAVTEGTITATRMFDVQHVPPTSGYVKQYPLGREPQVPVSKFVRIRVTATVTVGCFCYLIWEE